MEQEFEKDAKTILIVDDEPSIIDLLMHNLSREGYNIISANDGMSAVDIALEKKPDLILLDIMLPIIILTAKDTEIDKILGLELGADDYVTKPFSVRELIARVKANLRKVEIVSTPVVNQKNDKEQKKESKIVVGDLELDLDKFEVKVRGEIIDLTLREFEVLKFLATQPEQVVTREVLLEKVWGYEYYGDIRTVDVTVRRIREKIEKDTSAPKILITKRGVGYYIASK